MTTSSPEDAPRGMEFLYSLNRLNVATSRAQALVIVVGSPRLLEPECRSPRQMQLANALCRYVEMAQMVETPSYTQSGGPPIIDSMRYIVNYLSARRTSTTITALTGLSTQ